MPSVYRITQAKFKDTAMDGEGAFQYGGRWNSPGVRMVYCADSRALACFEIVVNLENSDLKPYVVIEVDIPESCIIETKLERLTKKWPRPDQYEETQAIGDRWINENESLAMWVPSAVVPQERNLLLNPHHPDSRQTKIHPALPFPYDPRLTPKQSTR